MSENNDAKTTNISKASNLEEIAEFWDTHSLDDYWDETHEAEFDIRAARRRHVTIDPAVYEQVEAEARTLGIPPETLVNLWLMDRLHETKVSE